MKTQSQYSPTERYKIQKIKREIQDLRKQLIEIDGELGGIKQNIAHSESNATINHFQEWLNRNDDSNIESEEENEEKPRGNYIFLILLIFYFVLMSFL